MSLSAYARASAGGLRLYSVLCTAIAAALLALPLRVHAQAAAGAVTLSAGASDAEDGASEDGDAASSDASASEDGDALPWALSHRRYASWTGPTGGLFLVDGGTGLPGAVRFQLGFDRFSGKDFLIGGDHVEATGQTFAISWTALKSLELYASLGNRASATSRPTPSSLDSLGDVVLGAKLGGRIAKLTRLGLDLRGQVANQVGGGGAQLEATSIGLRSSLSVDLQELESPLPLIGRLNVGYLFDNSAKVVSDIERRRHRQLNPPVASRANETRHLLNRFERFAMGINRVDHLSLGLGFELPFEVTNDFYVHPLVEGLLAVPINRQGYDCPNVASDARAGTIESAQDACYEREAGSSFPMSIAVGLRIVPPVRGFSALLGVDFGLSGTSTFVRELAPISPYRVLFAVSYDYDARPPEKVVVTVPAPAPAAAAPPAGRIMGRVRSSDGAPVAHAIVSFVNQAVSAAATSSEGSFVSQAFTPGEVQLELSHPDYELGRCAATIPEAGGDAEAECTLERKVRPGTLQGQVADPFGAPVAGARLSVSGPSSSATSSDLRGGFSLAELAPGEYIVRADAEGRLVKQTRTVIEAAGRHTLDLVLFERPKKPSISIRGDEILAPNLRFQNNTTDLDAAAAQSVTELADLLLARDELRLRIQGYGDEILALSRALLVKQRLIDAGVPEARLEAVGGGTSRVTLDILR